MTTVEVKEKMATLTITAEAELFDGEFDLESIARAVELMAERIREKNSLAVNHGWDSSFFEFDDGQLTTVVWVDATFAVSDQTEEDEAN